MSNHETRNTLRDCANFGAVGEMIDRTKKLPARFYVNSMGRKPVREWILELPEADRRSVGKDIQKVEFEWPLGSPHCAPLGSGMWEIRSTFASDRIARVIFCIGDGCMILLHGFVKKSQKTQKADIDLAPKRMKEVMAQKRKAGVSEETFDEFLAEQAFSKSLRIPLSKN